jgi:N-glycosylase/DNA lyase
MRYFCTDNQIELREAEDFDPVKTFECGQCFRWNADAEGVYRGVFLGGAAKVWRNGDSVFIRFSDNLTSDVIENYFDLKRDYANIRLSVGIDDYMKKAADYGKGIRILRQEPWEALCSFIISQCNNIPRIKKIIETMCRHFGEPFEFEGDTYYSFPTAQRISELTPCELDPLRCGYRAQYIIDAARAVSEGKLDLDAISSSTYDDAMRSLKAQNGIGDKVANCVVLFGLNMLSAFPVDVWIKKVLSAHYDGDFSPEIFGDFAGVAQQYMFFYARSGEK